MKRFFQPAALCFVGMTFLPVGAEGKAIRASDDPVRDERAITVEERQHWAYAPLPETGGPRAADDWAVAAAELDALIDAELRKKGWQRSEAADAATLLRRVTFDLTGLPPKPEQVRAFEAAFASLPDKALEAKVDELLASGDYGVHWAQWWLDMARYAETDGFEHDKERPRAWRYRDWVVAALNEDRRFDDFVRQQVAGDLLPDGEAVATGFLFSGPDMPDLNAQEERRHMVLNEITSTVGSAFLGLTVGCAQCHDHAFDPVSQADFYRLRAFFDETVLTSRDKPLGPEVRVFKDGVPASVVYVRGDVKRPGPAVRPGFPRVLEDFGIAPKDRAALAHWLTSPQNGLFLRTMGNRLWQQHFGRALAGIPEDLGRQGLAPSHPAVLDWLAAELPRQGWSLKRLHKALVMSQTYRQATAGPDVSEAMVEAYVAKPRRRLTGEMLRDAMLSAAGVLDGKRGGESVRLPLPEEVAGTLLKNQAAVTKDLAELNRRSLYMFARRNARHPIFDLFDRPDALTSCARRENSTTAPQALLLLNSPFARQMADELAGEGPAEGELERWAGEVFMRCLSRGISDAELEAARAFFAAQSEAGVTMREAAGDFCLSLLNANEFVWVD